MINFRVELIKTGVDPLTAAKFLEYHREHPDIWQHFEKLTLQLVKNGVRHYGAKAIMEVVRFHRQVKKRDGFKISNSYTAYYARIFAIKYPQHKKFFAFKSTKGLKEAA